MPTKRQLSFSSGEIAPAVQSRIDMNQYMTGLMTCKNWMVMRHGGLLNRPGSGFISEVGDSSKKGRLIPFIFSDDQTYVLQFSDLTLRIIRNGALLYETATNTVTGITQAVPAVVTTAASHGWTTGDEVNLTDIVGMVELNNRNFKITVLSSTTFSLQEMDGTTNVNAATYGAYSSGGTLQKVYEVVTAYDEDDLSTIAFVEDADVMNLVHPTYPPKDLTRTGHTSWSLDDTVFGATISAPTGLLSSSPGAATYYKVTAVDALTNEESLPSAVEGATNETSTLTWDDVADAGQYNIYKLKNGVYGWIGTTVPDDTGGTPQSVTILTRTGYTVTATVTGHGYSNGDTIIMAGANQPAYNGAFVISNIAANTFDYTIVGLPDYPATGTITATLATVAFTDDTYTITLTDSPPKERTLFDSSTRYPSTVAHYQQRAIFANTTEDPEGVWASKSTLHKNFMISTPLQDDDAVTFSLIGREVSTVKHILEVGGKLMLFTSSGEYSIKGNAAGVLTPTGINPKFHTGNGSSSLRPLLVDDTAFYIQERSSKVRNINYNFESDAYKGSEISIFAAHLFDGYTIVDWAYQKNPHSIIWAVRSDGVLLGLTYVKEQEIKGWHQHSFENGFVENVCVVPEGNEDALYLLIKRTINGNVVRYVERLKTREITLIEDAIIMDSSLTYDGRNTDTTWTMTISGGTTWKYTESLTMTSNTAGAFVSTDIGNAIMISDMRFKITAYTSDTVVTVKPSKTVPTTLRNVATSSWSKAVDEVSGLWHLEGENVSVLVDGYVSANPNEASIDKKTVTNGIISFADPHAVIHVGLPITADMETLDLDTLRSETLADKQKHINKVTMRVQDTVGLFVGQDASDLIELKMRNTETLNETIALNTGNVDVKIPGEWNGNGRFLIRQSHPLPASILSVMPAGFISGG